MLLRHSRSTNAQKVHRRICPMLEGLESRKLLAPLVQQSGDVGAGAYVGPKTTSNSYEFKQSASEIASVTQSFTNGVDDPATGQSASYSVSLSSTVSPIDNSDESGAFALSGAMSTDPTTEPPDTYIDDNFTALIQLSFASDSPLLFTITYDVQEQNEDASPPSENGAYLSLGAISNSVTGSGTYHTVLQYGENFSIWATVYGSYIGDSTASCDVSWQLGSVPPPPPPPPPPPSPPILAMVGLSVAPDGGSIAASFIISGSSLPSAPTFDFYWASGNSTADEIGMPLPVLGTETQPGSYTLQTSITNLGVEPMNANFIIAEAVSADADPNHKVADVIAPADVSLDSATVAGSNVTFGYHALGNGGVFTAALYESATATFDASSVSLVTTQQATVTANSSRSDTFTISFKPNPAQPHLLVVANPEEFLPQSPVPGSPTRILPAFLVSESQLIKIMPTLEPAQVDKYIAPLNEAMEEFFVNTPKREAAFLAQAAYESTQLTKWTESGSNQYFVNNYWNDKSVRKNLGNEVKADASNYRGRGPIQITGRAAYSTIGSQYIKVNILLNPSLVATDPSIGFRASAAYWTDFKAYAHLNGLADSVNVLDNTSIAHVNILITRYIVGTFNTKKNPHLWPVTTDVPHICF